MYRSRIRVCSSSNGVCAEAVVVVITASSVQEFVVGRQLVGISMQYDT